MKIKTWWRNLDSMDRGLVNFIVVAVLVIAMLFGICIAVSAGSNIMKCNRYQMFMPEENFVWDFWTSCLVEAPDGTFVSADDYFSMNRLGLFLDENE